MALLAFLALAAAASQRESMEDLMAEAVGLGVHHCKCDFLGLGRLCVIWYERMREDGYERRYKGRTLETAKKRTREKVTPIFTFLHEGKKASKWLSQPYDSKVQRSNWTRTNTRINNATIRKA